MRFSIDFTKAFFVLLRHSIPIWGGIAILITLIGLLIGWLEEELGAGTAIYFAWVTGTTVGYGDLTPTLAITRFLAIVIALQGIVFTGIIVAMAIEAAKIAIENNSSVQEFKKAADASANRRISRKKKHPAEREEENRS
jgi:voltage-gated potassium channel